MVTKEQIARINELARKKKTSGLTQAETEEQKKLRNAYVAAFKSNLKAQLDNIELVDRKPESEYTEAEKKHVANLSQKLKEEYQDKEKSVTEAGNPRKPTGEAGKEMIHRMNESHFDLTGWALSFMHFHEDDHILDIGCGGGSALKRMAEQIKTGHLTGVDYSPVSVKASKELNKTAVETEKMDIIEASVSDLPFEDQAFNKIITVESYYFWPNLEEDMKEVFRVLKPGGQFMLVAEIYQHDGLNARALENIKKYELRNLDIAEFEALFIESGFKETAIHLKDGEDWICVEGIK